MTNRRDFLQIGLAASAWPLASRAALGAGMPVDAGAAPLYKVVYDSRFEASVAFARRAAALGVPTRAIEGDMTRFWYDDLYHRWREGPVAIAGLTAHGPLFCFEQLARDQRMRVVLRAELAAGDGRNGERMAELVINGPAGGDEMLLPTGLIGGFAGPGSGESLYSWLIAPAALV